MIEVVCAGPSSLHESPAGVLLIDEITQPVKPLRMITLKDLPDTRAAKVHKFHVGETEGYLTVGFYPDDSPAEIDITIAKEGSTLGGCMKAISLLTSAALQNGVPVETLVERMSFHAFEPSGHTGESDIGFARSIVDYVFRYLGLQFAHKAGAE